MRVGWCVPHSLTVVCLCASLTHCGVFVRVTLLTLYYCGLCILQQRIELGEGFLDANPLDVGSVVKQFFRELPDPLFTNRLHDAFIRAYGLEPDCQRLSVLKMLCLLLPWHNLCVLRFVMSFLLWISDHSDSNKMDRLVSM